MVKASLEAEGPVDRQKMSLKQYFTREVSFARGPERDALNDPSLD